MKNKREISLGKVYLTNRFDRACNFLLLRMFPHRTNDEKANNCRAALEYAHSDLQAEKFTLKQIKNFAKASGNDPRAKQTVINALYHIEASQIARHSRMHEIIEGQRVR